MSDGAEPLSLHEKASLTSGFDFWRTEPLVRDGRVLVRQMSITDGPHGVRKQPEGGDHLGLDEALPATCFPTASAMASTWDAELVAEVGGAIAAEARALGVDVVLGPGVNIRRSPLCGRNFEYFSEDPVLAGTLGAAMVRGIQGGGVAACLKHFAANNQETDRMRVSADIDDRTLREIYLRAFEIAVDQGSPWVVMSAYNRINGTHAAQDRWLLTELLREDWGFDGLVVSDWGGVVDRIASIEAGLDLTMPGVTGQDIDAEVEVAVRAGRLAESHLDRAVRNLRVLAERTNLPAPARTAVDADAHHALARRAAAAGSVLLRNDPVDGRPLLPLATRPGRVETVVVGELARTPRYQGAGSSQVVPTKLVSVVDAFGGDVPFAPGYCLSADDGRDPAALRDEAVALAERAGTVVVVLGLPPDEESEGWDRATIELPTEQRQLVEALLDVNPRLVAVLANGGVVATSSWSERVPAVLECWLGGQASGEAVADVLTGRVNPSGRLPETIPLRLEDTPSFGNFPGENGHVRYGEGLLVGYRGYDARHMDVAFPFGHGLSYSTFEYDDLAVEVAGEGTTVRLSVAVEVTNTSGTTGAEVVQLYVAPRHPPVLRPPQELKAFSRVEIAPGASSRVEFELGWRDLARWDVATDRWVVDSGEIEVRIGASSRDTRATEAVTIVGQRSDAPVTRDSTLAEALGHPRLRQILREGAAEHGVPALTPSLERITAGIPLRVIADFDGMLFGRDGLAYLLGVAEADEASCHSSR